MRIDLIESPFDVFMEKTEKDQGFSMVALCLLLRCNKIDLFFSGQVSSSSCSTRKKNGLFDWR